MTMSNRLMGEFIKAAHALNEALLTTEVEERDVERALDACCPDWDPEEHQAVIRLACELADVKATALTYALVLGEPLAHAMAELEHYSFLAHELGGLLDLPVLAGITEEDREASIMRRFAHPLTRENHWPETIINDGDDL
jgi:hypothetical protein